MLHGTLRGGRGRGGSTLPALASLVPEGVLEMVKKIGLLSFHFLGLGGCIISLLMGQSPASTNALFASSCSLTVSLVAHWPAGMCARCIMHHASCLVGEHGRILVADIRAFNVDNPNDGTIKAY